MLFDDFPTARAIAVSGVCRVATLFWELLPKSTLKHLITKVVRYIRLFSIDDEFTLIGSRFGF